MIERAIGCYVTKTVATVAHNMREIGMDEFVLVLVCGDGGGL